MDGHHSYDLQNVSRQSNRSRNRSRYNEIQGGTDSPISTALNKVETANLALEDRTKTFAHINIVLRDFYRKQVDKFS